MATTNGAADDNITPSAGSNGTANGGSNGVMEGNAGMVRNTDIIEQMQVAYLDYAMSVIVARALPDVRDGLKPVHRRILYAMWHDLSLTYDKSHKKSARIVGEVLGKYHPHGDTAVYDAMVRMAQEFSLRYPLIDGQGNFGSVDGDNAAAMRYTEARLDRISNLMLEDLEKDTVEWHANFDNTLREPDIVPAALPNLLINGSAGIAVGMATNIPPHNLGEVVDGLVFVIDHYEQVDEITTEQLMRFVKGPDFPTGGILYRYREGQAKDEEDVDAIAQSYSVGKSRLIIQAKAHFEEISRGRTRIIITELPYQTNKSSLIERIADLVRDGKIEGITDLRDESDRTGMRVVIELNRNVEPKDVLANLFKYTPLQQTFGLQMLALADGQPRILTLKRMLQLFLQHRQVIIRRRSEYDLARARERAHIVEGLLKALDILDEVIATIRKSQTVDTARKNLMSNFKFTEPQASAILDMQLRRLAALERKKLQEEFDELRKRIAYLEDLLAHPNKILGVIREELLAIKEQYGDARRTQIVDRTKGALTTTDLLPDQQIWVSLTKNGQVRRTATAKPGAGLLRALGKDAQCGLVQSNTRDILYLFSKDGRCSRVSAHEIPDDGNSRAVSDMSGFGPKDELVALIAKARDVKAEDAGYLFLVTEQGVVKRINMGDVQINTNADFPVINVDKNDRLLAVLATKGEQEVLLVTGDGQSIRFNEEEVRAMGLPAGGVGGIKLKGKDRVVAASLVDGAGELLTATAEGYVKRSLLNEYSAQGRNGGGIVAHKVSERTGPLMAACVLPAGAAARDWAIFVTARGTAKPLQLNELPQMGRAGVGRPVVTTAEKDATGRIYYMAGGDPNAPADPAPGKRSSAPRPPAEQPELIDETPGPTPKRATPTQPVSGKVELKPVAPVTPAAKQPPATPAAAKETPRSSEPPAPPAGKRRTTLVDQAPAPPPPEEPAAIVTEPVASEPEEPPQNAFDFLAEVPEKKPAPAADAPKKAASNKLNAVVSVTKSMTEKKKK